jgi:hypothetical protein
MYPDNEEGRRKAEEDHRRAYEEYERQCKIDTEPDPEPSQFS